MSREFVEFNPTQKEEDRDGAVHVAVVCLEWMDT